MVRSEISNIHSSPRSLPRYTQLCPRGVVIVEIEPEGGERKKGGGGKEKSWEAKGRGGKTRSLRVATAHGKFTWMETMFAACTAAPPTLPPN